jgi:4-hydroxymandelate synthase
MDILDIDHIELFVSDAHQVGRRICADWGFRVMGHGGPDTGLPGQRSVLLGQGGIRMLLTTGLHADHPASQFVARHGDGVAVIAFGSDDTASTFAKAVAGGARTIAEPRVYEGGDATVVTAEVSSFGDVTHRLVERHGSGREFLPNAIAMVTGVESDSGDMLQIIDHAAVCLSAGELDSTVAFYEKVFGFSVIFEEYIEVGAQGMQSKVVQSPLGGATFTLIQPDISRRPGQIDDFLAWHDGSGVQHIALRTTDIVHTVATITARGVGFAETPDSYYDVLEERLGAIDVPVEALRPFGILVDRDHWGQMYQIFATSAHIRRTFFWEVIDRHGARTFGTNNIPALYAAKERELAAVRDASEAHLA